MTLCVVAGGLVLLSLVTAAVYIFQPFDINLAIKLSLYPMVAAIFVLWGALAFVE